MNIRTIFWKIGLALIVWLLIGVLPISAAASATTTAADPFLPIDDAGNRPSLEGGQPVPQPPFVERPRTVQAADAGLVVDLWYGDDYRFGHNGEPIHWVNIPGNVQSDAAITALAYSLNGQSYKPLDIGPTTRRLQEPGDFNVEIAYADLQPDNNSVTIRARDSAGRQTIQSITIDYAAGNSWTLPYVADWGQAGEIEEIAQVVDGHWQIEDGLLRPVQLGYDRLVGLGDINWTEYEITVPFTIHGLDEAGFGGNSSAPGIGLVQRWRGHFCWDEDDGHPQTDIQLCNGWYELGSLDIFTWSRDGESYSGGLQRTGALKETFVDVAPKFDTPYRLKGRVEQKSKCGALGFYRFKVWEAADPEPAAWNITGCGKAAERNTPGPAAGSMLLVAHHVDASFGPITVAALNEVRPVLTSGIIGAGTVQRSPDAPDYTYFDEVTLTALPDNGHVFSHWSGDIRSTNNPLTINITEDTTLFANFVEGDLSLDVFVAGSGAVSQAPDLVHYMSGDVVALTATPDPGWLFEGWSGDLTGSNPQVNLAITEDTDVMASFRPAYYGLDTAVVDETGAPLTVGRVNVTPPASPNGYAYDEVISLQAIAEAGWTFLRWEGDVTGSSNPASLTIQDDASVRVVFQQNQYALSISTNGDGSVIPSPSGPYAYGDPVSVQATADAGWVFERWSGDLPSEADPTDNPLFFTMHADVELSAHFSERFTLGINLVGNGAVRRNPERAAYGHGETVTLEAVPASGAAFVGWSGDATGAAPVVAVTMDAHKTVTALFTQEVYDVDITWIGEGVVELAGDPSPYAFGDEITLTAVAGDGWTFDGWAGVLSGSENPITQVVAEDLAVIAQFSRNEDGAGPRAFLPYVAR